MLRVGIVGTGNVGQALANGLSKGGHEVRLGSRDPSKAKAQEAVKTVPSKEAVKWGDVVILAVPHSASEGIIRSVGPEAFAGKVLVDVINPLGQGFDLAVGFTTSAAEETAKLAPGAKVVKAFNTVFAQNMSTGRLGPDRLTLFVAGNDSGAKDKVMSLGRDIGFDPVDAGGLKSARHLESMAALVITLAYSLNMGPAIGYKLVR